MRRFRFIRNPLATALGNNVEEFLRSLGGPACFFLEGRDTGRTRALVTLLHGNEPSGVMALYRWLTSGQRPVVNVVCIVASVAAALEAPLFSHRMLPRARDLNRCFRPPFEDAQGELAEEILEILRMHHPEAVVDVHNTSGSGPSFGVCTHMDRHHDALVSLFTQRMIVSNLGLGALMDISEHSYPTVTVEVGGRLDDEAHELAYEGMCRYFTTDTVLSPADTDWGLELLQDPIRLELNEHVTLHYAEQHSNEYDLTLRSDIEHLNFGTVSPETLLGWSNSSERELFSATDSGGRCAVTRLVRIEGGEIYPARPLKLFMITNNPDIASTDCLLYAVADDGKPV
ncbi:MAG: succinylglutamate desuccinylase/aspartoacylase family protein, partial [Halioglobus sp.]|nr:succinylglutamate desuccinylase/aspartoacylase family protein [Halioglobus sp.]